MIRHVITHDVQEILVTRHYIEIQPHMQVESTWLASAHTVKKVRIIFGGFDFI
jgi:hypothetical protein